jgi:hypothetical protein
MACYSRIQRTTMKEEAKLAASMRDLGYLDVVEQTNMVSGKLGGRFVSFSRAMAGSPFSSMTADVEVVNALQRKYSARSVREVLAKRGYSVADVQNDGRKLVFINRKGG